MQLYNSFQQNYKHNIIQVNNHVSEIVNFNQALIRETIESTVKQQYHEIDVHYEHIITLFLELRLAYQNWATLFLR